MAFFKAAFLLLALLEPVTVFGYPYSGGPAHDPYAQGNHGGAYDPYGQGGTQGGTQGGHGGYNPYGHGVTQGHGGYNPYGHGVTQGHGGYNPYGHGVTQGHGGYNPNGHGVTQGHGGGNPAYDPYGHQGSHGGTQGGHGGGHSWDYNRNGYPTNFKNSIHTCSGYKQSPINIEPACTIADGNLRPFSLTGYDAHGQHWHLKNNGHTAQMSNLGSPVILRGGGLSGDYVLDQFHFHWGSRNDVGSEHLIDGKASPLEMHMVHHSAYDSSQLAVLSFLFEMHQTDNPNFNAVLRYFDGIIMPDKEVDVPYFSVSNLIPRDFAGWGYFRYNGSLTTPPCSETVIWTVFEHKIGISYSQLGQFRKLTTSFGAKKMWDNFRMTQGINYRWVMHKVPYGRNYYYNQYTDCARSQYGGNHGSAGGHGGSPSGHGGSPSGHGGSPSGHGHAPTTAGHGGGHGGGHGSGHAATTTAAGGD